MATDTKKRAVVGGFIGNSNSKNFALRRILGDGTLDVTFGNNGNGIVGSFFSDTPNGIEEIHGIATTADDKIVVAGQAQILGESHFVVARYTQDGNLDTTFGANHDGKIVQSFDRASTNPHPNDSANAVVIQPDGKIVVVGFTPGAMPLGGVLLATTRYNTDGSLDTSYGNLGLTADRIQRASHTEANAVALDRQGNIIIAGTTRNFVGTSPQISYQFVVVRYTPNGRFDTNFNGSGAVRTHFPISDPNFPNTEKLAVANTVTINAEGKITVAGFTHDQHGNLVDAIASYNA